MKIVIIFIYLSTILISFTQSVKIKKPAYFGIQYKIILASNFLAPTTIKIQEKALQSTFKQSNAYSYGAITRIGLSKLLSIETGINQVKRIYDIDFIHTDSLLKGNSRLSMINYDIPINFMVYIPLSEYFYMNASIGSSFVFFPTNVATMDTTSNGKFIAEGRRISRFGSTFNTNFGFELRTKKIGFFYIGCSGIIPFKNIYKVATGYVHINSTQYIATGFLNGSYLSIDLRYYLPLIKKNEKSTIKGPFEQ